MPVSPKLKKYLDEKNVSYEISEHTLAYTASEIAGVQHVPGKQMVKSVIIKSGSDFLMCVLPAIHLIDFEKLQHVAGTDDLKLADEEEIAKLFPEYEIGAEPPFGHLYGLKVFVDASLEDDDSITFNAGSHTDAITMNFKDFMRITDSKLAEIGTHI